MSMIHETDDLQKTVDYTRIIREFLSKWYLYLAIILLSLSVSLFYCYFVAVPQYRSTAKIYIMNKSAENINTSDLSISSVLTKDYENLIVDRVILEDVIRQLDVPVSYNRLSRCVSVYNPQNTRFIEITVENENAETAKKIVDKICEISQEKIVEYMGIDRVTIIRKGNLPTASSSPNTRIHLRRSFLIGILLAATVLLIRSMQDDKIRNAEDVERCLEISLLGTIPYNQRKVRAK